ncbi:tyrosine-type recombinase/integrase [Ramlibacter sp.]|uniref:tyrosine-type recombinase/integrase n=1 Tax=Ramlibacter sp. TaxID=1917967 RepID=UPI003D0D23A4
MPLTVRQVEAAKPSERPYKLTDGQGLYLFVAPTGSKSWRANYVAGGKQKTRTYGLFPAIGLGEARKLHAAARDVEPGVDARKPTFEALAREWLSTKLPSLSNPKHKIQVENTLQVYAYPWIGDAPVDTIKRARLVEVVKAVQAGLDVDGKPLGKGDKIETAHRVAGRITAVFDYAQDVGVLEGHPASHLSRVLIPRRTKKPMPSIPKGEAGELLRAIAGYPEPVTRMGLLLMAHTFVRVNEILGFKNDELREGGAVWVVPAERVKGEGANKLPHVVPLSAPARALVRQLQAMSGCDLVLESPAVPGRPLSENTLLFALYRLGYRGRMTVHGFRALASTVLNEESPFKEDVIERQLAHKETDAVRAAYNRAEFLPQRRELMSWWSAWLERAAAGQPHASEEASRSTPPGEASPA